MCARIFLFYLYLMHSAWAGDPEVGNVTYIYARCGDCHGRDGAGDEKIGAPKIAGLQDWYVIEQLTKFRNGQRGAHKADAEGQIMAPLAKMLSDEQRVKDVAAYLSGIDAKTQHTLRGGKYKRGKELYENTCVACHGKKAEGNKLLKSPGLAGLNDWYVVSQLMKFSLGSRGNHPDDATGQQMSAIAKQLPDRQAMLDVATYLRTIR